MVAHTHGQILESLVKSIAFSTPAEKVGQLVKWEDSNEHSKLYGKIEKGGGEGREMAIRGWVSIIWRGLLVGKPQCSYLCLFRMQRAG